MTLRDLIDDLRSRINPAYATTLGTESYERRQCADALEAQADEIDRLREALRPFSELLPGSLEGIGGGTRGQLYSFDGDEAASNALK